MRAFAAGLFAKVITWLIHAGLGWIKGETPAYAMVMRRRSKTRILNEKEKARLTVGAGDDLAPLAADVYMGLATMRAAQHKLAEIFTILSAEVELPADLAACEQLGEMHSQIDTVVKETIRILDEGPDPDARDSKVTDGPV